MKLGFTALAVLLLAALSMPYFKWNWLAEAVVVLVYFPLLIALGAGAVLNRYAKAFCVFGGAVSYPLYMTYYAFIWAFANYYELHKPGPLKAAWIVTGSVTLLIALSYFVLIVYDAPVRAFLDARRRDSIRKRTAEAHS